MKINEKHLSTFAGGNAAIDKQGFLSKRGELNRAFQRRWFVLKGNLLFYFDRKIDADPVGVIVIEGCSIELSENADNFSFELVFSGSGTRTYVLAADSQEEMEEWMRALTCASYDYMRNAVSDLQRQLNELNAISHPVSTSAAPPVSNDQQNVSSRRGSRMNPFNQNLEELQDVFPAASFERHEVRLDRPRTFEEMHAHFGEHIALAISTLPENIGPVTK